MMFPDTLLQQVKAHIALVTVEVRLPQADSLKYKRRVVSSLKDRLRAHFNVAVAEIGYLDEWQRALVGAVMISNDRRHLEQAYAGMERLLREVRDVDLFTMNIEWL